MAPPFNTTLLNICLYAYMEFTNYGVAQMSIERAQPIITSCCNIKRRIWTTR